MNIIFLDFFLYIFMHFMTLYCYLGIDLWDLLIVFFIKSIFFYLITFYLFFALCIYEIIFGEILEFGEDQIVQNLSWNLKLSLDRRLFRKYLLDQGSSLTFQSYIYPSFLKNKKKISGIDRLGSLIKQEDYTWCA